MRKNASSGDEGVGRRELLAGAGSAGLASLAGCSEITTIGSPQRSAETAVNFAANATIKDAWSDLEPVLHDSGLSKDISVNVLSGAWASGKRQRVAIGRAIVRDPEVFLVDEPLANLDAALWVHMRTQLQRLHKELDTTIVYVTHNQEEAVTMSNRLAVMDDGEVQQFDTPLACYNRPNNEFVAGFIGSPSMNFLDARTAESGLSTGYFDLEFDLSTDRITADQDVTVGIRPEDIALAENEDELEDPSRAFPATVDVIEPVGDETFLYLLLGDADEVEGVEVQGEEDQLMMSTPPNPEYDLDEAMDTTIDVKVDLARMHLFDGETGEAIAHGITQRMDSSTLHQVSD